MPASEASVSKDNLCIWDKKGRKDEQTDSWTDLHIYGGGDHLKCGQVRSSNILSYIFFVVSVRALSFMSSYFIMFLKAVIMDNLNQFVE